jgi:synaptobrevin family protein YKT6
MNTDINVAAQEKEHLINMHRPTREAAFLIAVDKEYPSRSAFSILRNISNEYKQNENKFPNGKSTIIEEGIVKYQDPKNADKLLAIQANLEETQTIMAMNLEKSIARGKILDELAEKSEEISSSSHQFLRESKK